MDVVSSAVANILRAMAAHQLSRTEARRIAVQAQLLGNPRPHDLLDVVHHLAFLPVDMVTAVAPSADLIAWSRLGSSPPLDAVTAAVDAGDLIELEAMVRPAGDLALYRAEMQAWPGVGDVAGWRLANERWIQVNDACRRDILARLSVDGPLAPRDIRDSCEVPWQSSGWNNNRNVQQMIALMARRGEVAAAGRDDRGRLWDLAERVYPDTPVVALAEAQRERNVRRLRALGIARAKAIETPVEPNGVGDVGESAVIAGVRGTWRVDPAYLGQPFAGRAALLSPLDRLVADRLRMVEIFEFDYQLEMYKPVAKRRWGYYALPILYGDRLVGKLDAAADRRAGKLWVHAIHEDAPFSKAMTAAVRREITDLASWLQLDLALPG